MIPTHQVVNAEAAGGRIIFIGIAEIFNGLLGFPLDVWQVLAGAVLFEVGARFTGYAAGQGLARTRLAAAEVYGMEQARRKELEQHG